MTIAGSRWDLCPEEPGPARDKWLADRGWISYEEYVTGGLTDRERVEMDAERDLEFGRWHRRGP